MDGLERLPEDIKGRIVAQIGRNRAPKGISSFNFCSREESSRYIAQAEVLITHGGSTLMEGMMAGKRMVAVPRLKRYGEALNDHQLDLCEKLGQNGSLICVVDMNELEAGICKAFSLNPRKHGNGPLPDELLKLLQGWSGR